MAQLEAFTMQGICFSYTPFIHDGWIYTDATNSRAHSIKDNTNVPLIHPLNVRLCS